MTGLILPKCRVRLTAADVDFIISTVSRSGGNRDALIKLLTDDDTRDQILDDPHLVGAILESPRQLKISTYLYFYVLVRYVLRHAGVESRTVADYVAALMAEFSRLDRARFMRPDQQHPLDYLVDMIKAMDEADSATQFALQVHVGNCSLFWTGMFPDRLHYRHRYRGAPKLKYYEDMGCAHFRIASHHRLAEHYGVDGVFSTLSDSFHSARVALNDLSKRLVFLGA